MLPAQALASNDCLKELSFNKSYISDRGACAVCSTVKYLNHVEVFNLGECNLTSKGAEHVANMIKVCSRSVKIPIRQTEASSPPATDAEDYSLLRGLGKVVALSQREHRFNPGAAQHLPGQQSQPG